MTLTPGAVLLALALLILVLLVVARPFLRRTQSARPTTREELQAQKESYLQQIADLDFDHETGKMPDARYQQERQQLLIRAALILRRLDTLSNARHNGQQTAAEHPARPDIEAQIEQAILALRQQRSTRSSPAPNGGSHAYCPHCGRPVQPNDNFCRSCGHSLRQET